VVVNETEASFYGDKLNAARGYIATTFGAEGAALKRDGRKIAECAPPPVRTIDATGAGDTFTAALTLRLIEGDEPADALQFACAAAALATCRHGAQSSLPFRRDVDALVNGAAGD
jgi:ribokinase